MIYERVKARLPSAVRGMLGKARTVARRAHIWWRIKREISGVTKDDEAVLSSALLAAPMDIFKGLDRWRDPVVKSDCQIESSGIGTFSVRANTDDLYHALPSRELKVIEAIRKSLKSGHTFVDAGANIGVYSVLASKIVGDEGSVIAFEMMPQTASILRRHLEINNCLNTTVVEGALSDTPGQLITAYVEPDKHGKSSIISKDFGVRVDVKTKTLKDELRDLERIHLMKMDLEGAELMALKGLGDDLAKIDMIIYEEIGTRKVTNFLEEAGFKITPLDSKDKLACKRQRICD